jgi:hypothetical protein
MLPVRLGTFAFAVLLAEAAVLLAPFPRSSTPFVQGESQRRIVAPATCPITQSPSEPFVPPAPYGEPQQVVVMTILAASCVGCVPNCVPEQMIVRKRDFS